MKKDFRWCSKWVINNLCLKFLHNQKHCSQIDKILTIINMKYDRFRQSLNNQTTKGLATIKYKQTCMCNELCVQFTKTAIIFVMTDMWHKDKHMHIYMRLLKYDLLVVVTCQKHVRKKFIPIKHNIMWSWEICVEISMVFPSFYWYAYINIMVNFV